MQVSDLANLIGQEIGLSRWFLIDQERIDAFADISEDWQYIHTDPEKAAKGPFAGTIAHGFLSLSMLSAMALDAIPPLDNISASINYGFNRIRFVSPVRSDARIRGRFVLKSLEIEETYIIRITEVLVEIENEDKPALVAEWITRQNL